MKRIVLHSKVFSDIDAIMIYYERVANRALADDFYAELRGFIDDAVKNPELHPVRERDIRRINLYRFPYHFLYRVIGDTVRILVVRHNRRHPSVGTLRR